MRTLYENRKDDFYCRDSSRSSKTMGFISHLHYHIELGFIRKGHSRVTVDSTVYEVEGGDIIAIFPHQIHGIETLEHEDYTLLVINPDILPELSYSFTSGQPISNLLKNGAKDPELSSIIDRIVALYYEEPSPFREVTLHGYLLAFFGKLLSMMPLQTVQTRENDVLGSILNYCILHSAEPLSLSILEKELHISKCYISHVIGEKLSMGFNEYVNSIRISNACKQLRKTQLPITEICELVGFNTLRTFNRAFQKQMGITPSQYRQEKRQGKNPERKRLGHKKENS